MNIKHPQTILSNQVAWLATAFVCSATALGCGSETTQAVETAARAHQAAPHWMVRLGIDREQDDPPGEGLAPDTDVDGICTGSLYGEIVCPDGLREAVVITAAHCISEADLSEEALQSGEFPAKKPARGVVFKRGLARLTARPSGLVSHEGFRDGSIAHYVDHAARQLEQQGLKIPRDAQGNIIWDHRITKDTRSQIATNVILRMLMTEPPEFDEIPIDYWRYDIGLVFAPFVAANDPFAVLRPGRSEKILVLPSLPPANLIPHEGQIVSVCGAGFNSQVEHQTPEEAEAAITNNCGPALISGIHRDTAGLPTITESLSEDLYAGACGGDSGGCSVDSSGYIVGVHALDAGDDQSCSRHFDTITARYTQWIERTIRARRPECQFVQPRPDNPCSWLEWRQRKCGPASDAFDEFRLAS